MRRAWDGLCTAVYRWSNPYRGWDRELRRRARRAQRQAQRRASATATGHRHASGRRVGVPRSAGEHQDRVVSRCGRVIATTQAGIVRAHQAAEGVPCLGSAQPAHPEAVQPCGCTAAQAAYAHRRQCRGPR